MKRTGRQDDGWISEAKRMRALGDKIYAIADVLGVSEFRVQCALDPSYRDRRQAAIRARRASLAAGDQRSAKRPSAPRPLTQSELDE